MEGGLITGVFLKKIFFSLVDESSINLLAKVYILYDGLLLVVIKRSLKYCEHYHGKDLAFKYNFACRDLTRKAIVHPISLFTEVRLEMLLYCILII
jgi:hypothetical protein